MRFHLKVLEERRENKRCQTESGGGPAPPAFTGQERKVPQNQEQTAADSSRTFELMGNEQILAPNAPAVADSSAL